MVINLKPIKNINDQGWKHRMDRRVRLACLAMCAALLALTSFLFLKSLFWHGTARETVPLVSYNQTARVDYRVYFIPGNNLYAENSLGAGNVYMTNFVDYITTSFKYTFSADRVSEVRGEYGIVALAEALAGKENTKIWQREFVLLPKKAFSGNERTVSVQEELPLRLPEYNTFASMVIKDTELIPNEVNLTVRWNVDVEAVTDSGQIKDQIAPTLVVPLVRKAFEIGGEPVKEKPGAISATRSVPAQTDRKKAALYGAAAGLSAVILALLLRFTGGSAGRTDPLEARFRRIVKKYGYRMAVIEGEIPGERGNAIPVRSVDDLALIADELNKPVMYRPLSETDNMATFYVFDEPKLFVYELKKEG
ncbi:DUF5305 domain-containing protein [Pelotomaculum isophthalicicum JI]|uniref:DUF5305 domain-containing protein n=1 Tax=Pelotomaculum isophthalicicum JI TaxID=947010 RepID=A0A9X4JVV1_9FIRM|nr:DUF5305 family protein [Pelotomaculum isophthalicicum]MDF9409011.1 DUF5305 domain-containing protein [Pelotomaculum isophthalicicum JI]